MFFAELLSGLSGVWRLEAGAWSVVGKPEAGSWKLEAAQPKLILAALSSVTGGPATDVPASAASNVGGYHSLALRETLSRNGRRGRRFSTWTDTGNSHTDVCGRY